MKDLFDFGESQGMGFAFVCHTDLSIIDLDNGFFHIICLKELNNLSFIVITDALGTAKLFEEGGCQIAIVKPVAHIGSNTGIGHVLFKGRDCSVAKRTQIDFVLVHEKENQDNNNPYENHREDANGDNHIREEALKDVLKEGFDDELLDIVFGIGTS
jgi:hypothetical protein